jgi:capsule polysaccharide export protein KpsE/RkpR
LLRVVAWSFVVSVIVVLLIPNRYVATTRLMPPDNQANLGSMLSAVAGSGRSSSPGMTVLGGIGADLLGIKNSGALFVGILEGRTVQDQLIQEFDLKKVYGNHPVEDLREALAKHTEVKEDRKSGIISITVTDHDPRRATAMATAYVHELDRLVAQVSTSSARRERIFLEDRLSAVKKELDTAANNFSEFASQNTAIDIPEQAKAMVAAAARLQGELVVAESELRGLEAIYTDQNVRVRALRAKIAELRAQLEKLGGDTGNGSGAQTANSTIYPSIRKLPLLGVKYFDLYRETKIQETVFELLTQQYELAKVQEAKEIPSVKVLDAAVVPTKKVFPPRALLVCIGMFVSLVLGCSWLSAKDFWKGIDPQEPGKKLVMEIVGTLQSDVARLNPRIASRNGNLPLVAPEEKDEQKQEVARAARHTGA